LVEHRQVQQAAVLLGELAGEPQLVAYLLTGDEIEEDAWPGLQQTLRQSLAAQLPDFMVPTLFLRLHEWPLNYSGKLDRSALPIPAEADLQRAEFIAPRNPMEAQLAVLWESLLGVSRIGVEENFFALGGNSLLVLRMVNAIERNADIKLLPRVVFEAPTVAQLAHRIAAQGNELAHLGRLYKNASELEEIEL
jgi:acyl carrier protein